MTRINQYSALITQDNVNEWMDLQILLSLNGKIFGNLLYLLALRRNIYNVALVDWMIPWIECRADLNENLLEKKIILLKKEKYLNLIKEKIK